MENNFFKSVIDALKKKQIKIITAIMVAVTIVEAQSMMVALLSGQQYQQE